MVEQHDVDLLRHLGDVEDRIRLPVDARHLLSVEAHLFQDTAARCLDDVAFDDVVQQAGIDDAAAVMRDGIAFRPHFAAAAIDLDLGCDRDDRGAAPRVSDAAAARGLSALLSPAGPENARLPAEFLGRGFDGRGVAAR